MDRDAPREVERARVGLCATCQHVRRVETLRKTTFYRCEHSRVDPSFPKYPTLPVRSCAAYVHSPPRPIAAVSWSGGKDACLAFHRARVEFDFAYAITMMDESGERSRSHGLRREVMQAQVDALGLQWLTRKCSWESYEAEFVDALRDASRHGVTHLVCGDILYPEHRNWVERRCEEAGLFAVEPIYGCRTVDVYREFLGIGGVANVVAVEASKLSPDWLFRCLDEASLPSFAQLGVDPCGENGEYHTLVTDCPAFSRPLVAEPGERVLRRGYWAVDVRLVIPA